MRLLDGGHSLNDVGRMIGCAPSSVMRWRDSVRRHGRSGLAVRMSPGRPRRLTAAEERSLVRLLLRGPVANGFKTELWTTLRIAQVIENTFGVDYHRDHVGRLMHRLGWSAQKPERRAIERNEKEIERWKREEWPRVKKTPRGWAPTSSSSMNPASS
jgi:transposase